jgi:STE24 endopeptidase
VAFNLVLLVVYPTLIAPLFNKFQPLPDESLKARVQALMQRCGFAAKGLFVMDGSRRSAHANAYFTGLGAAKRVVFYDTLLQRLTPGEVEAVLAHELGHFKRRHVTKRMAGIFGMSLSGLALLGWLAAQSGFYTGLGVQPNLGAPNDALALILFMLALPPFGYFVSPLMAHFSRKHEFEADAYACAQADGAALASALRPVRPPRLRPPPCTHRSPSNAACRWKASRRCRPTRSAPIWPRCRAGRWSTVPCRSATPSPTTTARWPS